jgi:hypothetical protein
MAECIERAFNELEVAVKQAGPHLKIAGQPAYEEPSNKRADALQAFHDASQALDKAIDSLGGDMSDKKN